ncbi:MAG: hypothetical protein K2Q18_06580 [Bdellovibrionales bacterium]|nr:hypothetical protein [Bdellovibrionales bacterium]
MSQWIIKNSFQKTIFEEDLITIESWNDVVFYYSKIVNDNTIYTKNYFFFLTSSNAPFSKDECLRCLDFSFDLFHNNAFCSSMSKEDANKFSTLMIEIKNAITKDSCETFFTTTCSI